MLIKSLSAQYFSAHNKLPFLPTPLITFFVLLFSIFLIVTFLCASHDFTGSRQKRELRTVRLGGGDEKKGLSKLQRNISSKALSVAKMVSWRKRHDPQEERQQENLYNDDEEEEEAVWKRTIIMGEKCRPLEFSGKLTYDSHGDPVLDSKSRGSNNTNGT